MKSFFNYYLALTALLCTSWESYGEQSTRLDPFIGIDLGTKYACVGVFKKYGKVDIVDDNGNRCIPSYVAFTEDGQRLIGDSARRQLTSNPNNTIFDVKRFIGRTWNDTFVQQDIKLYPFKLIGKDNRTYFEIQTADGVQTFVPEEITAMILGKLKEMAEDYLDMKVYKVVVTVPAYFNDAQRSATKDAATIAGFTSVRLINEPTAAAISHEYVKKDGRNKIVVYDLGGGTFDVSVIESKKGVFKVLASSGDTHLGGEDFDQRVMEYFLNIYKKKTGKDIRKDNHAVQKLRREVEKAKIALSSAEEVTLEIQSFINGSSFQEHLTRAKFEELNMDLWTSTLTSLESILEYANINVRDIDEILLVGGSTRIPKIQKLIRQFFQGKKLSQVINPDEAVVVGAAVQAGVLSGQNKPGFVSVTDVNPLTLSYKVRGRHCISVIPKYTWIPAKESHNVDTVVHYQRRIKIEVYEGESLVPKENHLLGTFLLTNIEKAPSGYPNITVTFDIDVNGILKVTARDLISGSVSSVKERPGLSSQDIKYMINRTIELRDKDKEMKNVKYNFKIDLISLKNEFIGGEKQGTQVTKEKRESLLKFVQETIDWLDSNPNASLSDVKSKQVEFEKEKLIFNEEKETAENKEKDKNKKDEL